MSILINLNGDAPQSILDARRKASEALRALDEAMRDAAPHGRNYATQTDYLEARQIYNNLQHAMSDVQKMWNEDSRAAYQAKERKRA
jgi:uncharacterized protein YukE